MPIVTSLPEHILEEHSDSIVSTPQQLLDRVKQAMESGEPVAEAMLSTGINTYPVLFSIHPEGFIAGVTFPLISNPEQLEKLCNDVVVFCQTVERLFTESPQGTETTSNLEG